MLEVKYLVAYSLRGYCLRSEDVTRKFTTGEFASYFRRFGKYTKIKSVRRVS